MKQSLGIIDYEFGNTQSVCNALETLNTKYILCSSPESLDLCSHIILPGVGSFASSMKGLEKLNLINSLNENVLNKKVFFLGICVGFQIIFSKGHEFQISKGLNWINGDCKKIDNSRSDIILPHNGWNEISSFEKITIFEGIDNEDNTFYFNHSFSINDISKEKGVLFSFTNYGNQFVSAIQKENIFGVQFHPEKSQKNGLKILKNFINL
tara:strand:+ start:1170 stop:1799 length:630 start_codon:yes stop_codon:yes gene_type:complete